MKKGIPLRPILSCLYIMEPFEPIFIKMDNKMKMGLNNKIASSEKFKSKALLSVLCQLGINWGLTSINNAPKIEFIFNPAYWEIDGWNAYNFYSWWQCLTHAGHLTHL